MAWILMVGCKRSTRSIRSRPGQSISTWGGRARACETSKLGTTRGRLTPTFLNPFVLAAALNCLAASFHCCLDVLHCCFNHDLNCLHCLTAFSTAGFPRTSNCFVFQPPHLTPQTWTPRRSASRESSPGVRLKLSLLAGVQLSL